MNSPEFLQQMSAVMSNPAILDQIIASNPQLGAMGPQAREMLQSERFRQMMYVFFPGPFHIPFRDLSHSFSSHFLSLRTHSLFNDFPFRNPVHCPQTNTTPPIARIHSLSISAELPTGRTLRPFALCSKCPLCSAKQVSAQLEWEAWAVACSVAAQARSPPLAIPTHLPLLLPPRLARPVRHRQARVGQDWVGQVECSAVWIRMR